MAVLQKRALPKSVVFFVFQIMSNFKLGSASELFYPIQRRISRNSCPGAVSAPKALQKCNWHLYDILENFVNEDAIKVALWEDLIELHDLKNLVDEL